MSGNDMRLACACGKFHLEVSGEPIISTECHCQSCRDAAARLPALAARAQSANGGTHYVLCRKDRIRFPEGTGGLKEFRLAPDSPTRRVLAVCCDTPIFLEFKDGHWLSLYASLWPEHTAPSIELRTMTKDLPPSTSLAGDVPAGALPTAGFYARLLGAWIAMGFKVPAVSVPGVIEA